MKTSKMVVMVAVLVLVSAVLALSAQRTYDWESKFGVGVRGPLIIPMFEGSDFTLFDTKYEPFGMGWDLGAHARLGLTERIAVDFSIHYASSYDDSTATSDQSFSFNGSDDAFARIEGMLYSLTGNYYFRYDQKTQPYLTAGLGWDNWRVNRRLVVGGSKPKVATINDIGLKFGGGVGYWLSERLNIDGQLLLSYGLFRLTSDMPSGEYGPSTWRRWKDRPFKAYMEPSIGLTYYLFDVSPDADKDGVKDKADKCPDTPLGALVDKDGCPLDEDQDGVYDGLDVCPGTPLGATVDVKGCPLDTDQDGVFDGIDQCPNTPLGTEIDETGCPIDSDRDGVPDLTDKCPDTPLGVTVDADGCPVDSDKDGVPDMSDRCPDTPAGVEVDSVGCPTASKLEETLMLYGEVKYASDVYTISPEAHAILDSVAVSLKAYPYFRIEIRGYTDSLNSEQYNLMLSTNRAETVKKYLVSKEIAADRMETVGLGEDPQYWIGDNGTAAGRRMNRRVEIEVIRQF
ncbi:MAG: OmpA family protein [candidate division Zixibacteria bacterium]|nr:OmpA family protein [candidate division Zixibacteria bacterium]